LIGLERSIAAAERHGVGIQTVGIQHVERTVTIEVAYSNKKIAPVVLTLERVRGPCGKGAFAGAIKGENIAEAVGNDDIQFLVVVDVGQHNVVRGVKRNATDRAFDRECAATLVQINNGTGRTAADDHVRFFVAIHVTDRDTGGGKNARDRDRVVCPRSKCARAAVQQNAYPATRCIVGLESEIGLAIAVQIADSH
jgi:hypothetical protein